MASYYCKPYRVKMSNKIINRIDVDWKIAVLESLKTVETWKIA